MSNSGSPTHKTPARRGYHHGNLREALEVAALELVAERGARGFTLAEAARRAGVSPSAPYRHFAHRDDLLAALAINGFRVLGQVVEQALRDSCNVADLAAAYVGFALQDPARFEVMSTSRFDKEAQQELLAETEKLKEQIARIVAPLEQGGRNSDELVIELFSIAHGVAALAVERRYHHIAPSADPVTTAKTAAAAWVAGLSGGSATS